MDSPLQSRGGRELNLIVMLVLMIIVFMARDTPAQTQCPELPFYLLVPFTYACPIHPRVCHTDYGYCRLPWGVQPGTPCSCLAANGVWLPGLCRR